MTEDIIAPIETTVSHWVYRLEMKILHTSDWHLGQHFMMKTREAEHLAFLHWLIEIIALEGKMFAHRRTDRNHFVLLLN